MKKNIDIYNDLLPFLKNLNNYGLHKLICDNNYLSRYNAEHVLQLLTSFNYNKYDETVVKCLFLYKPYFKELSKQTDVLYNIKIYNIIVNNMSTHDHNIIAQYISTNDLQFNLHSLYSISSKNTLNNYDLSHMHTIINHTIDNDNLEVFEYIINNIVDIDNNIFNKITDKTYRGIKFLKLVSASGFKSSDNMNVHLGKYDFCSADVVSGVIKSVFDNVVHYLKNICKYHDYFDDNFKIMYDNIYYFGVNPDKTNKRPDSTDEMWDTCKSFNNTINPESISKKNDNDGLSDNVTVSPYMSFPTNMTGLSKQPAPLYKLYNENDILFKNKCHENDGKIVKCTIHKKDQTSVQTLWNINSLMCGVDNTDYDTSENIYTRLSPISLTNDMRNQLKNKINL